MTVTTRYEGPFSLSQGSGSVPFVGAQPHDDCYRTSVMAGRHYCYTQSYESSGAHVLDLLNGLMLLSAVLIAVLLCGWRMTRDREADACST